MRRALVVSLCLAALAAVLTLPAAGTGQAIRVPAGFRVGTFASGLHDPTAMAYGPDGRIYVTQDGGPLVAIRRGTRRPAVLVRGLRTPLGLAWRGRQLFVSDNYAPRHQRSHEKLPAIFAMKTAVHKRSSRPRLRAVGRVAKGSTAVTVLSANK